MIYLFERPICTFKIKGMLVRLVDITTAFLHKKLINHFKYMFPQKLYLIVEELNLERKT
jgi:hypothetical protein